MANYRAVANGNWSAGATWAGGAVPPNGEGHNIYSNNFTITIDTNVNVALITNASNAGTFVGGGTAAAGGGFTVSATGFTVTANITTYSGHTSSALAFTGATGSSLSVTGNVTGNAASSGLRGAINLTGGGTLTLNGNVTNVTAGNGGYNSLGISASSGILIINGSISSAVGNASSSILSGNGNAGLLASGTVNVTINSAIINGNDAGSFNSNAAIWQSNTSVVTLVNCIVSAGSVSPAVNVIGGSIFSNNGVLSATNGVQAISASLVTAYGTFVYSPNGTNPVGGARLILDTPPTNAYTQFALNGINSNSFFRYYTADNALGQANPTDVRSGVSYASGALTGRLTVPARGSVALSVNYGPSMPFTATCSGTTATATLAYSYPLVVGDTITVTGSSNSEWNSTYTIASVVSGTSVTFVVPATHSATAGTGATMQTTGTAVLDPTAIATAVQNALTAQGLTSARAGNLDNLDTTVSSRLSPSGTLATVTNLTNAPASVTPSDIWGHASRTLTAGAGITAADIWSHASRTITGGTVTTLTNAPSVPTPSQIASQVRTELSVELGRVDQNISSRLAGSAYTAPANSDITAIKAKTDNLPTAPAAVSNIPTAAQNASATRSELSVELARVDAAITTRATPANIPAADITAIKAKTDAINVDRINNTATLSQVGNLLAQANS